jgi:hypothetical protein
MVALMVRLSNLFDAIKRPHYFSVEGLDIVFEMLFTT